MAVGVKHASSSSNSKVEDEDESGDEDEDEDALPCRAVTCPVDGDVNVNVDVDDVFLASPPSADQPHTREVAGLGAQPLPHSASGRLSLLHFR